jgi:hypothetical protein
LYMRCCLTVQVQLLYVRRICFLCPSHYMKVRKVTTDNAFVVFMNRTVSWSPCLKVRQEQGQLLVYYLKE